MCFAYNVTQINDIVPVEEAGSAFAYLLCHDLKIQSGIVCVDVPPSSPSKNSDTFEFERLRAHVGHDVEVAIYGDGVNVSVECIDCCEVIYSVDNPVIATDLPKETTVEEQSAKEYDLSYGFLGNGITVWNRAVEVDRDYVTVAHIETDRSVKFYDKDMPHEVKQRIDTVANSPDTRAFGFSPAPESIPPRIENLPTPASVYEMVKRILPETAELKNAAPNPLLPDPTVNVTDMNAYGYKWEGMLPLTESWALELYDSNNTVFLLYPDNTEAQVVNREDISNHDGVFGIEAEDWQHTPYYAKKLAEVVNQESRLESELLRDTSNRYGIYQIRDGIENAQNLRFTPLQEMEAFGLSVNRTNYELVYTAPFTERIEFLSDRYPVLNKIYSKFNTEHPADYTGRSVSVSDVIVLRYNGDISTHFVDNVGFRELDNYAFFGDDTGKS